MLRDVYDQIRHRNLTTLALGILLFYAAAYSSTYYALWHLLARHSALVLGSGLVGRSLVSIGAPSLIGTLEDRWPRLAPLVLTLASLALVVSALPLPATSAMLVLRTILPALALAGMTQSSPRPLSEDRRLALSLGWLIDVGKVLGGISLLAVAYHPLVRATLVAGLSIVSLALLIGSAQTRRVTSYAEELTTVTPALLDWPLRAWVILLACVGLTSLSGFSYDMSLTWPSGAHIFLMAALVVVASAGAVTGTTAVLARADFPPRRLGPVKMSYYVVASLVVIPIWELRLPALFALGFLAAYYQQPYRSLVWLRAPAPLRGRLWSVGTTAENVAGLVGQALLAALYAHWGIDALAVYAPLAGVVLAVPLLLYVRHLDPAPRATRRVPVRPVS